MSFDYQLVGSFPVAEPEREVLTFLAAAIDAPTTQLSDGNPWIRLENVQAYGVPPEPDELPWMTSSLGFTPNLTVMWEPYGGAESEIVGETRMVAASSAVVAIPGTRATLFSDYGADDGLILTVSDQGLVLNSAWDGWTVAPELLAAVTVPYRTAELHFADRA